MQSVLGIYARETGQGMIFSHDNESTEDRVGDAEPEAVRPRPHLKIVK